MILSSCTGSPEAPAPEPEYWGYPDLVIRAFIPPMFLAACIDADDLVEELHDDDNCTTSGAGHLQFDGGAVTPAGDVEIR